MKKLVTLMLMIVFSFAVAFSQEQTQNQNQTKTQTQTQVQTQETEIPIQTQTQERVRINEGQGTMTRAEKKSKAMNKERKQNHGSVVSETAQGTSSGPGKGQTVSGTARQNGIQQQDRDRTNFQKQAKPMNARPSARPPMNGIPPRMGAMQRGGRK